MISLGGRSVTPYVCVRIQSLFGFVHLYPSRKNSESTYRGHSDILLKLSYLCIDHCDQPFQGPFWHNLSLSIYRMGGNFRGVKISCYFEEAIILNFPWVLIFVGAIFRVYLKSRFLFKVIMETTCISSVIRISSVFSHHVIQLLGQFLSVQ